MFVLCVMLFSAVWHFRTSFFSSLFLRTAKDFCADQSKFLPEEGMCQRMMVLQYPGHSRGL